MCASPGHLKVVHNNCSVCDKIVARAIGEILFEDQEMNIKAKVGNVNQLMSKPNGSWLRTVWTVRLYTYPHVGDIQLSSDALSDGSEECVAFIEWASKLKCGDDVEITIG